MTPLPVSTDMEGLVILEEAPANGNPPLFVTIHEGIGGWNSSVWGWNDELGEDAGFYEPHSSGNTNTSLGTGKKEDAIAEAKAWAIAEELPLYLP